MELTAARYHLKKPGPLRLSTVCLVVALFLLAWWTGFEADPRYFRQIQSSTVEMQGFAADGTGFRATGRDEPMHMLVGRFSLEKGKRYAFSLSVDAAPGAPASIVVDLYGPGYDNPTQERSFTTQTGQLSTRWSDWMDVGQDVPDSVSLRIFYSGQPGLRISDIRVVEISKWRIWIANALRGLVLASLAAFLIAVASWSREESRKLTKAGVPWALLCALWLGFALVRFLLANALPYWSGDEYVYKTIASGIWAGGGRSGIPLPEQIQHATNLPNMLYPYLIAPSFVAGDAFYSGVRLINAIIVTSALFPIFLLARRFLAERLALLVAGVSIALPAIFISAYAVTEVLYFPLSLWCCLAAVRCLEHPNSWLRPVVFGVLVGVLLNVRLNGITLLPSLLLAWLLSDLRNGRGRNFIARPTWMLAPVTCYAAYKLITVNLVANTVEGLGLYENHSGGWMSTALRVAISDLHGLAGLLLGHLTILAIPFSLGIAAAAGGLLPLRSELLEGRRWDTALFLIIATLAAVAMAIIFTLGVSPVDLGGLGRWHSRYYFSTFPLLLILLFLPGPSRDQSRFGRYTYLSVVAIILAAAATFVFVLKMNSSPWFGATVDSMEAHWYRFTRWWFVFFAALVVAIALLREGPLKRTLQIVLVASWLLVANSATWIELKRSPGANDAHCGALAYHIAAHEPGSIAVVASGRRELVDNVFWLPYLPATTRMLPGGGTIDARTLNQARYVLADGSIEVSHAIRVPDTGTCSLYKVNQNEQ